MRRLIFVAIALGGTVTAKDTPLLATPPTVTTTLPVVAAAGTGTTMLVADQLVGVAAVPLNVTVLVPWVVPNMLPLMVTAILFPAGLMKLGSLAAAPRTTKVLRPG